MPDKTIIIVENDENKRKKAIESLSKHSGDKFNFIGANNPRHAVELIQAGEICGVLSNPIFPGFNFIHFKQLDNQCKIDYIPLVVCFSENEDELSKKVDLTLLDIEISESKDRDWVAAFKVLRLDLFN